MKIAEAIRLAVQEERCQRKYTRITLIFMTLAMILLVGVNSFMSSIKGSQEKLLNRPLARIYSTVGLPEDMKLFYEELKAAVKESDVFGSVVEDGQTFSMDWKDSKQIVQENDVQVTLKAWFPEMQEYLCDGGKEELAYGEVVIPKYLYDMGVYDAYNYIDTASLVGKTITFLNQEKGKEVSVEYQWKVVGTYDNIAASSENIFFANGTQISELYLLHNEATDEELLALHEQFGEEYQAIIHEFYGGDALAYWREGTRTQTKVGVYVKEGVSMEEAQQLFHKLGKGGRKEIYLDDSLMLYFDFIIYMGNLISVLLLVTAFVNILIMVSSELQRRKGEFALKYAMGYQWKDILLIFSLGKFICFVKAFFIAVAITGVLVVGGNYVIQTIFPLYLKHIVLNYNISVLLLGSAIVIVAVMLGMCMTIPFLRKIKVANVLKRED